MEIPSQVAGSFLLTLHSRRGHRESLAKGQGDPLPGDPPEGDPLPPAMDRASGGYLSARVPARRSLSRGDLPGEPSASAGGDPQEAVASAGSRKGGGGSPPMSRVPQSPAVRARWPLTPIRGPQWEAANRRPA